MRDLNGRGDLCRINTGTLGYREPIEMTAARIAGQGFGWITPARNRRTARPQPAPPAALRASRRPTAYCRTAGLQQNDAARSRGDRS